MGIVKSMRRQMSLNIMYAHLSASFRARGFRLASNIRNIFALSVEQMNSITDFLRYWLILQQCCINQYEVSQGLTAKWQQDTNSTRDATMVSPIDATCHIYDIDRVQVAFMGTRLYKAAAKSFSGSERVHALKQLSSEDRIDCRFVRGVAQSGTAPLTLADYVTTGIIAFCCTFLVGLPLGFQCRRHL